MLEYQSLEIIARELHQTNELLKLYITLKIKEQDAKNRNVNFRLDSKFQEKIDEVLK